VLAAVAVVALVVRGQGPAQPPATGSTAPQDGNGSAGASAISKENWRMPALTMLAPVQMSRARRIGMLGMWLYLVIAIAAVVFRIIEVALGH
jgi:hypothetical protein